MFSETHLLGRLIGRRGLNPKMISEATDWARFFRLLEAHHIAPLLYYYLREEKKLGVFQTPVQSQWEERYRAAQRDQILKSELFRPILEGFNRRGIVPTVLKGTHLGRRYYPAPALRPGDDIDLLIRPEEVSGAAAVFTAAGWEFVSSSSTARRYGRLDPEGRPVLIAEIHSSLRSPARRNPEFSAIIEDFRRFQLPFPIEGADCRVLEPELNLVYLSAHLGHHGYSRLIWFYDLDLIIREEGEGLDWEAVIARSVGYRSASAIHHALALTVRLLGTPVPEEVLRRLAPPVYKRYLIARRVNRRRVLTGEFYQPGGLNLLERFIFNDSWPRALRAYLSG